MFPPFPTADPRVGVLEPVRHDVILTNMKPALLRRVRRTVLGQRSSTAKVDQ